MISAGTPLRRSARPGWYGSGCPMRARAVPSVLASWTAPSASASHSRGLASDGGWAGTCRLKRTLAPGSLALARLSMSFRISAERQRVILMARGKDGLRRAPSVAQQARRPAASSTAPAPASSWATVLRVAVIRCLSSFHSGCDPLSDGCQPVLRGRKNVRSSLATCSGSSWDMKCPPRPGAFQCRRSVQTRSVRLLGKFT